MSWLDALDWLGSLPAELVLAVPVVLLTGLFGIILSLRRARLRRWRAIAAATGLRLNEKTIVDSPELSGDYRGRQLKMTIAGRQSDDAPTAKQLLGNGVLRHELIQAEIERMEMFGSTLSVYYAREERDSAHAEGLFDAVVHLANAIDALKKDEKPERIS